MSKFHKIVKYLAVAFAVFIVVSIISGIMYGIIFLGNVFNNDESNLENLENLNLSNNNFSILDINIENSNVLVKEGTSFKVESNDKYISVKEINNKLIIKEKKHNWFGNRENSDLIIYIPVNYNFDEVSLETGAGKVDIEHLSTKKLDLDLGAGKVNVNNLNVSNQTEIDGGAGEIILKNSNISNLDLDMGVGSITIESQILGNSEIDSGVGQVNINLLGNINDYKIKANKGIGKFLISGVNVSDNTYYGNGSNFIDVDGGVGEININFN